MNKVITVMFILAGIIHLVPITGVFGPERLATLYGLNFQEPNLSILMRHRAILFGLLGAFLIYAGFYPSLQPLAFIAGLISVISFILIAWSTGDYNAAVYKIIIGDLFALVFLIIALAIYIFAPDPG